MKSQTEVPATRPAFKELDLKKAKTLETQLKDVKGVKEVSLTIKAKRIIAPIKLSKVDDDSVFEAVAEIISKLNFKVGRCYYIEDVLTMNLTQK